MSKPIAYGLLKCGFALCLLCVAGEGVLLTAIPAASPTQIHLAADQDEEKFITELVLHPNGKPVRQTVFKDTAFGKVRHGCEMLWDKDGRLLSEHQYDGDILHGPAKLWYPSGQLRTSGWYVNGEQSGQWLYYAESGKLAWEQSWRNGKEHGRGVRYDEKGRARTIYARFDEASCDVAIFFNDDGQCGGWDITVPENLTGERVSFGDTGSVMSLQRKEKK